MPFSDPLADGPTIQRSTFQALEQGMTLAGTLELIARCRLRRPVVVFSYLNPILRYGLDRFLRDAGELGVAGLLLTDLPGGERSGRRGRRAGEPAGSHPPHRAHDASRAAAEPRSTAPRDSSTWSRGSASPAPATRWRRISPIRSRRVREATTLPVAVGFGISSAEQAAAVGRLADGVVVGSALVDVLGTGGVPAARRFLGELRAGLDLAPAMA